MAALYHFKLCRAILVGFRNQLKKDGVCKEGFVGMLEACSEEVPATLSCYNLTSASGHVLKVQIDNDQIFKDDLNGRFPIHFGESSEEERARLFRRQGRVGVEAHL